jgi:uncharacterized membrane protein
MNTSKTRSLLLGFAVAASMLVGGLIGATVLAKSTLTPANAAPLAAASPTPKSNEATAHETAETPAQEAAENNGTARPGGGHPNESAAHEAGETAAQEAAEDAAVKAAPKA